MHTYFMHIAIFGNFKTGKEKEDNSTHCLIKIKNSYWIREEVMNLSNPNCLPL